MTNFIAEQGKNGGWFSGQHARLLLQQYEFKCSWRLNTFLRPAKLIEKNESKRKEAGIRSSIRKTNALPEFKLMFRSTSRALR